MNPPLKDLLFEKVYALTNIRSYAKRGDQVTIVSKPHDNVWICEIDLNRFPCRPELLSATPPVDVVVEVVLEVDLFNQPV